MSDRAAERQAFLCDCGWGDADVRMLAGDASFRRYLRLGDGRRTAVLMDAPPPLENVRPFVRMARHLAALGLSAPAILAADEARGFLLLEDFGDDTFTRLLADGADEEALYALAIDVLAYLHRLPPSASVPEGLPRYDERRLLDEAALLTDWYLPAVQGEEPPHEARESYLDGWRRLLPLACSRSPTLVLRDFHVDNLMRLVDRSGLAACGLLDFQDAVAGPAAYDLMSLLEDARRDVAAELKARMLDRYAAQTGVASDFAAGFAILAAQRHAKVIGIFTRLSRRDGKPIYLRHIPRVWRLLEQALRHPALAEMAAWFDRWVPSGLRRIPPAEQAAP